VPAGELERVLVEQLVGWLHREDSIAIDGSSAQIEEEKAVRQSFAMQLERSSLQQRRELLLQHSAAVELGPGRYGSAWTCRTPTWNSHLALRSRSMRISLIAVQTIG
jgi:hypothetical protein